MDSILYVNIWIGYLDDVPCLLTLTVLYKPMLSFSSKLFIPLVYLFITIPSLVQSHEFALNRRVHGPKRFLKNRAFPDPPVANVAALPSPSTNSQIVTPIISQSTASDTSPTTVRVFICFIQRLGFDLDAQQTSSSASTSAISTSTGAASTIASSQGTSSIASSTSSSTATNPSSSSTSPTSQTSANIDPTPIPLIPTASVVASTITSTQSLSATASGTATPQAQSTSSKTVTYIIAIAASMGGFAIFWTIFRKWKLSSSKKFDNRLNPITNWQPTKDDSRPRSTSSFHSSSGEGHNADFTLPTHDFTAGCGNTAPIGGYADLARTSSTNEDKDNPLMQQTLGSFNHGYDVGVPLHHGYGTYNAHDYNGRSTRY